MQPLQREDEEMLEDADESWDDEVQDVVPLMMSQNDDDISSLRQRRQRQQRQRLKSLEIAMRAEEDEAYYPSCLGDSWRLLASVLLAGLMAGPMLLRYFRVSSWPSDSLPCALNYGISYSETFKAMEEATDFCKEVRTYRSESPESSCTCHTLPVAHCLYCRVARLHLHIAFGS
jgi:hypothetical protein